MLVLDPPEGQGANLVQAIAEVTDLPVTAIVYSHYHADHIISTPDLLGASKGVGVEGVRIIASTETDGKMRLLKSRLPLPTETVTWPDGSFEFEGLTVQLNGFTRASHTDDAAALVLVGGHGNVASKDDIQFINAFLDDLDAAVANAMAKTSFGETDFPEAGMRMYNQIEGVQHMNTPACTGAIKYRDVQWMQTEIENFWAALGEVDVAEGFITVTSPGTVAQLIDNQHYETREVYLMALPTPSRCNAMRSSTRASSCRSTPVTCRLQYHVDFRR